MTAAQITALVVMIVLADAIGASLVQLQPDSDPALVLRAIDGNAAQVLALLGEDEP